MDYVHSLKKGIIGSERWGAKMRQRIADLLADLPETDSKLLTLRFGLEGGLPLSPEEAGRKLGLTPEEVVSREAAALAKLRSN